MIILLSIIRFAVIGLIGLLAINIFITENENLKNAQTVFQEIAYMVSSIKWTIFLALGVIIANTIFACLEKFLITSTLKVGVLQQSEQVCKFNIEGRNKTLSDKINKL